MITNSQKYKHKNVKCVPGNVFKEYPLEIKCLSDDQMYKMLTELTRALIRERADSFQLTHLIS